MSKPKKAVKQIVIPLVAARRPDGSVGVTSPNVPIFYVVGADEASALDNAVRILREHLERNSGYKVRRIRLADDSRELFPEMKTTGPAHAVAELAA